MPTLHSLLIGINEYPPSVSNLGGCVNDARALDEYLSGYAALQGWDYRPLLLLDQQATRQGIIDGFRQFEAAQDGDVCVWAYAGHGSRAPAPEAFWHQAPDKLHECLVCWDSREPGGRELLDKEMAWLVWKATQGKQLHFLVLMDCCFSGTNLRLEGSRERRAERNRNARPLPLEAYLGHADYIRDVGGYYSPPRGQYIQLAAARSDQPAREMHFEDGPHGVFTYALLDQLKGNGQPIRYDELYQRVRARTNSIVPEQSPQLDDYDSGIRQQLFLRQEKPMKGARYWAFYHRERNAWALNMGSLDGVKPDEEGQASARIAEEGISARIREVYPSIAIIEPEQMLSRRQVYSVQVQNLGPRMLQVALAPGFPRAEAAVLEAAFQQAASEYVEMAASPEKAIYWVHLQAGKELALYPRGGLRPAFRKRPLSQAHRFWQDADKLGRWDYVRRLNNPESRLPEDALAFELYQMETAANYTDASPKKAVLWPEPLRLDYRFLDNQWRYPAFQCKITNTSRVGWWVGALFLGNEYSISHKVLPKVFLEPGETTWLRHNWKGQDSIVIRNGVEEGLRQIGVTRNPEMIKVVASTEEFSLERYNQEGLAPDGLRNGRGPLEDERPEDIQLSDWVTYEIRLITSYPLPPQALSEFSPAAWFGHALEAPAGFWASTNLYTLETIQEKLPESLWILIEAVEDFTPYAWTPGFNQAPGLKVLGLQQVEGWDLLSNSRPLSISLPPGQENIRLLPLGFDANEENLSPISHNWENGRLLLHELPQANRLEGGEEEILIFLHYLGDS